MNSAASSAASTRSCRTPCARSRPSPRCSPSTTSSCFVASLFGRDQMRRVVHAWADFHHDLVRLLGTRVAVEGQIPAGAYLIAVKHQSMFETLEMMRIARTPVVVMKRELSTLPGFGWATLT